MHKLLAIGIVIVLELTMMGIVTFLAIRKKDGDDDDNND